jgi:hypothetical protein
MKETAYIVKPEISKGAITDNEIIGNIRMAFIKAQDILDRTYKRAIIEEITIEDNKVISSRVVTFEITAVAV